MNPKAIITDEQFQAYLKQIRELAEGPFEELQKEIEVTNTFPEKFYELAKENDLSSICSVSDRLFIGVLSIFLRRQQQHLPLELHDA